MTSIWALAALWLGLALIASLLSIRLRVSTALSEIIVGTTRPSAPRCSAPMRPGSRCCRARRHRSHLPRRSRTRPDSLPAQMEGSDDGRSCRLLLSLLRLRGRGLFSARLAGDAELACRRRPICCHSPQATMKPWPSPSSRMSRRHQTARRGRLRSIKTPVS